MQRRREYSGTVTVGSSTESRPWAWGSSGTTTFYTAWTDFLNSTIAAFLTECGVSASYTQKSGDSYKWLYIYGIPFFAYAGSSTPYTIILVPPFASSTYNGGWLFNNSSLIYRSGTTVTYNFGLNYAGKAESGFYLRAGYSSGGLYYISGSGIAVIPCTSVSNSADAVAWIKSYSTSSNAAWQANVMELTSGGLPVTSNYDQTVFNYVCGLSTKEVMKNDGKFPLVPMFFGKYKAKSAYLLPLNYGVPQSAGYTAENMTEFSVASRTFLNLSAYNGLVNSSALSFGILDVT